MIWTGELSFWAGQQEYGRQYRRYCRYSKCHKSNVLGVDLRHEYFLYPDACGSGIALELY